MTTRKILPDGGRCLRAAAAPLLTLGVLALARTAHVGSRTSDGVDELFLVAWRTVEIATLHWVLIALIWASSRPWRDRHAFQRLQRLREMATPTGRALVHVQTTLWSSTAGEDVVVVNVTTGGTFRVWLPEMKVPVGAFVVLERTDGGVSVVEWMNAHQVEAGHRHEMRRARSNVAIARRAALESDASDESASELVRETEEFLKSR